MNELNETLKKIPTPERIKRLPISAEGYYMPWFVPWTNGVPEPTAADPAKVARAHRKKLCWCCGAPLGQFLCFVIGPMCCVNRISSEPPSHRECGEYAVKACPFLSKPRMRRNPNKPEGHKPPAGIMIERNPGVVALWITKRYRLMRPVGGGVLFCIGEPESVTFYREGRLATRDEIMESITTGLPALRKVAEIDGGDALAEIDKATERVLKLLPAA